MIGLRLSLDDADWERQYRELQMAARDKIRLMLEAVGAETVAYLRSLVGPERPPAVPGEGPRQAHPGGWADVTGMLSNSYGFDVYEAPGGIIGLELRNTAEHAIYLEARDGYWVLSGVTHENGHVAEIIRRYARAAGFEVA